MKTKRKKDLIRKYLEIKGRKHQTAEELFADVMTHTKGRIIPQLLKVDIKQIQDLKQFTLPAQMPKIKRQEKYYN